MRTASIALFVLAVTLVPAAHARIAGATGFFRFRFPKANQAALRNSQAKAAEQRSKRLERWREYGRKARAAAMRRQEESRQRYQRLLALTRKRSGARGEGSLLRYLRGQRNKSSVRREADDED